MHLHYPYGIVIYYIQLTASICSIFIDYYIQLYAIITHNASILGGVLIMRLKISKSKNAA